jgi:hypothetical protein
MLQAVAGTGAYVAGGGSTQIFFKRLLSMPFPFPGCPCRATWFFYGFLQNIRSFCKNISPAVVLSPFPILPLAEQVVIPPNAGPACKKMLKEQL